MADLNTSEASDGQPPVAEDQDLDAQFAAFASKIERDPLAGGSQPIEEPQNDAEPPVSTATGNEPEPELPAPEAAAAPAETTAPDIWANATPELKAAFEEARELARKAELDAKAHLGRVRAHERTVQDLHTEIEGLKKQVGQAKSTETSLLESDEIKALESEYGDVAGPLLKVIKAQDAKINELTGTVTTRQTDDFITDQETRLNQAHPDWGDLVRNPGFKDWKEQQPLYVQRMIERNANAIVDAEEAGDALSRFRQHIGAAPAPAQKQTPTPPEPRTDERRQRQMAGGADVRVKAPPVTSADVEDPDQLFAQFANKIDAKARR
jgi:hypothetical protein